MLRHHLPHFHSPTLSHFSHYHIKLHLFRSSVNLFYSCGVNVISMCFYNGIQISRAEHIRLMELEKSLRDYELSLNRPMQSGFDFTDWPVIKPVDGGENAELVLMHWELIPHYFRTWADVEQFRKGGFNPRTGKKIHQRIHSMLLERKCLTNLRIEMLL